MTKILKSGEVKKENITIGDSFITRDDKHKWEGQDIEVKSDPLIDSGTGKPVILRVFDFGANPETLKRDRPTKQQLFDSHAKQITATLWADGLTPLMQFSPTIQISKKKEKYRIFVYCEPKMGVALTEKPLTLQELTKSNG